MNTELLIAGAGAACAVMAAAIVVLLVLLLRLRRSWAKREQLERRHRNILSYLEETVLIADRGTERLVDANRALLVALDYERDDLPHLDLRSLFVGLPDKLPVPVSRADAALLECRMRARDGHLLDVEITVTPVLESGRELVCIVGRDVSLRKQAEERLRASELRVAHVAVHDSLTGLPNRQALQRRLPPLLEQAAIRRDSLLLMHIDLDHFKHVNECRGHEFSDRVLELVAQRLAESCGPQDLLIRMGGDEFMIVCAASAELHSVAERTQRIRDVICTPIPIDEETVALTASIGVAAYPRDGLDAESLLKHADIALYEAKSAGRDTFRTFSSAMNVQLIEQVALEQALRRAIDTEQIYLDFQPIMNLESGLIVSVEALARWKHPDLGQIPPNRFIPVAERSGLIVALGEQVLRAAVRQLRDWQRAGVQLVPVAINVSPLQFERTSFCELVQELALEYEVDPAWLTFEVTESNWLQDSNKHIVILETLRMSGSRVYIDDFGTGFSNLGYLKTLPVDAIKIDQGFVRAVDTDSRDAAIVGGILAMANNLKLMAIAEGVETVAQADKLRAMGCQFCQGYYYSKPVPAEQCRALLEQQMAARRFNETVKVRAFRVVKSA